MASDMRWKPGSKFTYLLSLLGVNYMPYGVHQISCPRILNCDSQRNYVDLGCIHIIQLPLFEIIYIVACKYFRMCCVQNTKHLSPKVCNSCWICKIMWPKLLVQYPGLSFIRNRDLGIQYQNESMLLSSRCGWKYALCLRSLTWHSPYIFHTIHYDIFNSFCWINLRYTATCTFWIGLYNYTATDWTMLCMYIQSIDLLQNRLRYIYICIYIWDLDPTNLPFYNDFCRIKLHIFQNTNESHVLIVYTKNEVAESSV